MIVGQRVRLRALEESDLERCYRWINDPEVTEHLTARFPVSTHDERKWLLQASSGDADRSFAIETAEGEHIGNIGLHRIHYLDRNAELGILIGEKDRWNQGYGTDAILTLLKFAFEEMNLHRVYLRVDADNPRAIRCYEKCGFVKEGTLRDATYRRGRYKDQYIMSVLAHEFRAAASGR
ncbi:MAG: GNAT family protein [Anaerolineae bacterium]|nr:GNAT family protein [Anaerolineae bacterium]